MRCKKMPPQLREWPAYHELKKEIEDFQQVLPLLMELSKKSIQQRHWQQGLPLNIDYLAISMCILVVALHCHPRFPFICAHNRDEQRGRPSLEDRFESGGLLCGRDALAGGTVLALQASKGTLCALTNCRTTVKWPQQERTSRGHLVESLANHWADEAESAGLEQFIKDKKLDPFHVVVGNIFQESPELHYVWRAPGEELATPETCHWTSGGRVWKHGIFVISNELQILTKYAEHPNPLFQRETWMNLNGPWQFAICPEKLRLPLRWEGTLQVPFCLQSPLSGALDQLPAERKMHLGLHGPPLAPGLPKRKALWYARSVLLPASPEWSKSDVWLHVGACDSYAEVLVNGKLCGTHLGGNTPFSLNITSALARTEHGVGEVKINIKCTDASSLDKPVGKQLCRPGIYKGKGNIATLYSNITGIWQTVWLEARSQQHLAGLQIVAKLDHSPHLEVQAELATAVGEPFKLEATLFTDRSCRDPIAHSSKSLNGGKNDSMLQLLVPQKATKLWCPETPHLYGLKLHLRNQAGEVVDKVTSYAALRSVTCHGDQVCLNGTPTFLRLVLDQGYYPDAWILLRAEGVSEAYQSYIMKEWATLVRQLQNHPSILVWGIFNEFGPKNGWDRHYGPGGGFKRRYSAEESDAKIRKHKDFVQQTVQLVRRMDGQRRPIHDSSGWIHVSTDLWSFHDYEQKIERWSKILSDPTKYLDGRQGQPLLVGEFAGVGFDAGGPFGFNDREKFLPGYVQRGYELPSTADEALLRIQGLTAEIYKHDLYAGYCFTQLYDVEYEKNGLLKYDRTAKFPLPQLRQIFDGHLQTGRWRGRPLALRPWKLRAFRRLRVLKRSKMQQGVSKKRNPSYGEQWPKCQWLQQELKNFLETLPPTASASDLHSGLAILMSRYDVPNVMPPQRLPNWFPARIEAWNDQ
eukprot:s450_g14.t2